MVLTIAEAAQELSCSRELIVNLISDGRLQAVNIGRSKKKCTWRIPRKALEAFVANGRS